MAPKIKDKKKVPVYCYQCVAGPDLMKRIMFHVYWTGMCRYLTLRIFLKHFDRPIVDFFIAYILQVGLFGGICLALILICI